MNKVGAKLGTEAFFPTDLETECEKAARILRVFTIENPNPVDVAVGLNRASNADDRKKTQKARFASSFLFLHVLTRRMCERQVIKLIHPDVIRKAKGLAIFTVWRLGVGVSGAGGSGVVLAKLPDGSWSPPSGLLIHTLGIGWLAGTDIYDTVLVLRTQAAVDAFTKPRVTVGAELSVAAGPVGNGMTLDAGINSKPCWAYTKSKARSLLFKMTEYGLKLETA